MSKWTPGGEAAPGPRRGAKRRAAKAAGHGTLTRAQPCTRTEGREDRRKASDGRRRRQDEGRCLKGEGDRLADRTRRKDKMFLFARSCSSVARRVKAARLHRAPRSGRSAFTAVLDNGPERANCTDPHAEPHRPSGGEERRLALYLWLFGPERQGRVSIARSRSAARRDGRAGGSERAKRERASCGVLCRSSPRRTAGRAPAKREASEPHRIRAVDAVTQGSSREPGHRARRRRERWRLADRRRRAALFAARCRRENLV